MDRIRLMVWGAGFISRKWLEAVRARTDCEVVAIADRLPAQAEALRNEFNLAGLTLFGRWEEAAEKGKADAVIITLPQAIHPGAVMGALTAGLHVLCEKPLALDIVAAQRVYEATRAHPDRVVMVDQNFRWRPHIQALKQSTRDGLAGRVGHIWLECRQQIRRKTVEAWREMMEEPFLLDYAIHHFDLMRYLTGEEAVQVVGKSFNPPWSWFAGNASAAAIVTMQSGAVVDYGGTMVSLGLETPQEGVITVTGDKGTIQLDAKSQVTLHLQGEARLLPQEPIPGGEFAYGLNEFLAALRERRQPETHVAEHIRSLALLLAVVESCRRGGPVEVADLLAFMK